jgi:hypothetical protein
MTLKHILLGATFITGIFTYAQEETEQERECKRNRFLAGEAVKVQNFKEASMYYIKGEKICGGYDQANYQRLLGSLQNTVNQEADADTRAKYIDTLLMFFDKAEELKFIDKSSSMIRGLFYLQSSKPDNFKADKFMKEGIEVDGINTNEAYIQYYYQNLYGLYAAVPAEKRPEYKKRLINEYFSISKLISTAKMSAQTQETINKFFNEVVKSCEDILPELKGFMGALPQEIETKKVAVNNFIQLLEDKGCDDSKEYEMLIDTLIKIDPSATAIVGKAKGLKVKKKYAEAIAAFKDAKAMTTDAELKDEIEYQIAECQLLSGSYKAAYSTAMSVSGKNKAKALAIAAKCVFNTANDCGVSTFDRKCNYYYAAELAERAGDASLAAKARANFPSSGDIFDEGKAKGQSVSLSCWNVSVTLK